LGEQSADFILLAEWRRNANGLWLKGALENRGYTTFGESRGPAANGLLIATSRRFSTSRLTPTGSINGEIISVNLENDIGILCCYFPQRLAKKDFFAACLEQVAKADWPLLIIGDLNTGRNEIDLERGAAKFACANEFAELTENGGMADLWRRSNGHDAQEWTWRSPKNGFRIDHAFANRTFLTCFPDVRCCYEHSPRTDDLTDHSALIVEIQGKSAHPKGPCVPRGC